MILSRQFRKRRIGGVSGWAVWRMRVEGVACVCVQACACSKPRSSDRPWCQETHMPPFGIRKRDLDHHCDHAHAAMRSKSWSSLGAPLNLGAPCKLYGYKWFVTDVRPRNYIITAEHLKLHQALKSCIFITTMTIRLMYWKMRGAALRRQPSISTQRCTFQLGSAGKPQVGS